jgi:hypothetical protein
VLRFCAFSLVFIHHHFPSVPESTIRISDNGSRSLSPPSRRPQLTESTYSLLCVRISLPNCFSVRRHVQVPSM